MKKPRLGNGGIKGFFAQHIEKILLAGAMAVAAFLVWSGFKNRAGIETSKTPASLVENVTSAVNHIEGFSWATHYEKDRNLDQQLLKRANEAQQETPVEAYSMNQHIRPPVNPPRTKRTDPTIFAAVEVTAKPGYGALVKTIRRERTDGENPEDIFENARNDNPLIGGTRGRDDGDDTIRPIPNSNRRARPTGEGRGGGFGTRSDDVKGVYFVSVTGLVPLRKQLEAYQQSFLNARGFSSSRDLPNYKGFILYRAEVTEHADQEPVFKKIANVKVARETERELGIGGGPGGGGRAYRPSGEDDMDPDARDPILTRPAPNLVCQNIRELLRHDKIATFEEAMEAQEKKRKEEAEAKGEGEEEAEDDSEFGIDSPEARMRRGEGRGRGGDYGRGDFGRGDFGRGEYGGDYGRGEYGGDYGRGEYGGDYGRGEYGGDYGRGEGGFGPMGMMPGAGERGGEYGGQVRRGQSALRGDMELKDAPENLMFRYLDFDVVPGKSYQYRLKLLVEDPNNPAIESVAAPNLDGSVIARVAAEKAKKSALYKLKIRVTKDSQVSNVVRIQQGERLIVGKVHEGGVSVIRDSGLSFRQPTDEPTATVVALEFDRELAADIPGELEVRRGSVPYFTKTVEAPIYHQGILKKLENHTFRVNTLVLDIRGGSRDDDDPFAAPGEVLVFDSRGRLDVLNELAHADEYAENIFPPEEETRRPGEYGGEGGEYGGEGDRGRGERGRGDRGRGDRGRGNAGRRGG